MRDMTKEEFKSEMYVVLADNRVRVNNLHVKYATANNPHKIGDVITDNLSTKIKIASMYVEKIMFSDFSEMVYKGPLLKKDGTPFKSGEQGVVHQRRLF